MQPPIPMTEDLHRLLEADSDYFLANPSSPEFMRDPHPGELEHLAQGRPLPAIPDYTEHRILVQQLCPGVRKRTIVSVPMGGDPYDRFSDDFIGKITR